MPGMTATHQAGHVVMAWLCGLTYDTVSLSETCTRCHDAGLPDPGPDDEVNILTRADVVLAGPLSEAMHGRDPSALDQDDMDYATDLLRCMGLSHLSDETEDVMRQLSAYRKQTDAVAALLADGRERPWKDIADLLGPPGRSLSVAEQQVRYRCRVLHRIAERLDREQHDLHEDDLPPDSHSERWREVDSRCRSVWARWVESGQEAIRLRQSEAEKSDEGTLSVSLHPRALCRAEYRLSDIGDLVFEPFQEENQPPTREYYLMGEVDCDLMVGGYLCHSCPKGPPPHRLRVIINPRANKPEVYDALVAMVRDGNSGLLLDSARA